MGLLNITRHGNVNSRDLEKIVEQIADAILDRFKENERAIADLKKEVRTLRSELETERRLRLARKR